MSWNKDKDETPRFADLPKFPEQLGNYLWVVGSYCGYGHGLHDSPQGKRLSELCDTFRAIRNCHLWSGVTTDQAFRNFYQYCRDNGLSDDVINAMDVYYSAARDAAQPLAGVPYEQKIATLRGAVGKVGVDAK